MADYYIHEYPCGLKKLIGVEKDNTQTATVVYAGRRNGFIKDGRSREIIGIQDLSREAIIISVKINGGEKLLIFDKKTRTLRKHLGLNEDLGKLEGRHVEAILQYGEPVGIRVN